MRPSLLDEVEVEVLQEGLVEGTMIGKDNDSSIILSDTIKRGTLSKNRKNCLDLVNIEAKRQPRGLARFSDSPEARAARPRTRYQLSASPEAPSLEFPPVRPRTRCRFSASLEAGSAATPSLPPRPGCHVQTNATNHSHDVSRTMAQHSIVTDEVGVASTPCRPGQDGAGVTDCCARHCTHN